MSTNPDHPHPDDDQAKKLPHDPPMDDIADIVEFVDEDIVEADAVVDAEHESAFDSHEPQSGDSVPHVSANAPQSPQKQTDSVLEDEMAMLLAKPGLDSDQVSGIFSSVARKETESAVVSNSEIIRAEPLSDTVALDPISEIAKMKTDSDIRTSDAAALVEEVEIHATEIVDEALLGDEEVHALPESAVDEIVHLVDEDAVGGEHLPGITDSSVSLRSFRGSGKLPEQEPVVDLDETLAGTDSPRPKSMDASDPTVALDAISDGVDFDDLVVEEDAGSAVNLGQKSSAIDPVAEELESGVRLTKSQSPPSVEFDELIVEDDDLASVDLGAERSQPKKGSAKLPKAPPQDTFDEAAVDVVDVADEMPAVVSEDDVDINALLDEGSSDDAAAVVDEEVVGVVDEPVDVMSEPEPAVTSPKHGKRAAVSADVDAAPPPYVEPKRRGGWGGLIGGALLGTLLTAGAGAGVWFAAPDLIPLSPSAVKPVANTGDKIPVVPPTIDDGGKVAAVSKELEAAQGKVKDLDSQVAELTTKVDAAEKAEQTAKLELKTAAAESAAIEKTLRDAKILAANEKFEAEKILKFVKDLNEATASLAAVSKALEDAKIDGGPEKGIEKLLSAKKDAEDKIGEVNKLLADEKIKDAGAKGVAEIAAAREKLAKDREELDMAVKAAYQQLVEGKLAPEGGDPRKDLIVGAKAARTKSESPLGAPLNALAGALGSFTLGIGELVTRASDDAGVIGEIAFYRARDSFLPTAEQQIDRYAAALSNRDLKDAAILADANRMAEFVISQDAKATPATKAKAAFVQGLSLRNQEKIADAQQALAKAVEMVKGIDAPWAQKIRQAHVELTDPAVFYIPRIEKLRTENPQAALKELDAALVIVPGNPRLAAERSLIKLEQSRDSLDAAVVATIRSDAEAAAKEPSTAAAGNYVLGRVEEQSGNFAKAEEHFRQALKAAGEGDEQAARIRLSLGRLLLRERAPVPAPKAKPAEKEVEKEVSLPGETVSLYFPLEGLVAAAAIGQVPAVDAEDTPEAQARIKEALDLARQLLGSKDRRSQAQGHMLLGEALSRQGQRSEGLREYAKGLELLYPEAQLSKLLDDHPAFSLPDSTQRANPLLAEKYYGVGLHFFHLRRYAEAEEQFRQAISYFDKDARYYYFLGMSQMQQGTRTKRDAAIYAWEQASKLEANSRPSTREINAALERIQGDRRTLLDAYRSRSVGTQ